MAAVPFRYNLRNLMVRRTTTFLTAMGIALSVLVLVGVLAMVEGLNSSLTGTSHPLNLLLMRRGATSEMTSMFYRTSFQDVRSKPGVALGPDGQPLVSLEIVTGINLPGEAAREGVNITLRGLLPVGLAMRERVRIVEGRWFEQGRREVVAGRHIASRYPQVRVGSKITFGRGDWEVVGIMDAARTATDSEVFADLNQVSSDFFRMEVASIVLMRAEEEIALQALKNSITDDRRLNVIAQTEREYYDSQTAAAAPLQYIGSVIAVVLAIGSSFAAMNTMYTAVSRRTAEIGTLRVLGFTRGAILFSFMLESLLLSLLGGMAGVMLALPLNRLQAGISSTLTFTELVFELQITPQLMAGGVLFALAMGALGGWFPAWSAARRPVLRALRQV
jgi:putative ABC transport system permease protein